MAGVPTGTPKADGVDRRRSPRHSGVRRWRGCGAPLGGPRRGPHRTTGPGSRRGPPTERLRRPWPGRTTAGRPRRAAPASTPAPGRRSPARPTPSRVRRAICGPTATADHGLVTRSTGADAVSRMRPSGRSSRLGALPATVTSRPPSRSTPDVDVAQSAAAGDPLGDLAGLRRAAVAPTGRVGRRVGGPVGDVVPVDPDAGLDDAQADQEQQRPDHRELGRLGDASLVAWAAVARWRTHGSAGESAQHEGADRGDDRDGDGHRAGDQDRVLGRLAEAALVLVPWLLDHDHRPTRVWVIWVIFIGDSFVPAPASPRAESCPSATVLSLGIGERI